MSWDEQFKKSSNKLVEIARQVRKEIAEGKAEKMVKEIRQNEEE